MTERKATASQWAQLEGRAEPSLDRVPVAQAQASCGLSRSSFYKRLQHAGVVPLKVGVSSFLTQADLNRLEACERWVQAGRKPEDFLVSFGATAPPAAEAAIKGPAPSQWSDLAAEFSSCILELRDRVQELEDDSAKQAESANFCVDALVERIEALENDRQAILGTGSRLKVGLDAAKPAESNHPAKPDSSLVERVSAAIHPSVCADPNLYLHESRAAIRAVQAWLIERKCQDDWLAPFDEIVSLIELELRNV
jgi:hypothetical protein